jgi:hypothetical protein
MKCLKLGCPRTKNVFRTKDIGKNVVEIHSLCPWHEGSSGDKGYEEFFFDKKGRKLDWETWKPL